MNTFKTTLGISFLILSLIISLQSLHGMEYNDPSKWNREKIDNQIRIQLALKDLKDRFHEVLNFAPHNQIGALVELLQKITSLTKTAEQENMHEINDLLHRTKTALEAADYATISLKPISK